MPNRLIADITPSVHEINWDIVAAHPTDILIVPGDGEAVRLGYAQAAAYRETARAALDVASNERQRADRLQSQNSSLRVELATRHSALGTAQPVSSAETVPLRNGPTVPLAAVRLALGYADRGIALSSRGETLVMSPRAALRSTDYDDIRSHRAPLLAIARYGETIL